MYGLSLAHYEATIQQMISMCITSSSCAYAKEQEPVHAGQFLARRCKDLLDSLPSPPEQTAEVLQEAEADSALAMSLRYSLRRKAILQRGAYG